MLLLFRQTYKNSFIFNKSVIKFYYVFNTSLSFRKTLICESLKFRSLIMLLIKKNYLKSVRYLLLILQSKKELVKVVFFPKICKIIFHLEVF